MLTTFIPFENRGSKYGKIHRGAVLAKVNKLIPVIEGVKKHSRNASVALKHSVSAPLHPIEDKFCAAWEITEKELLMSGSASVYREFKKYDSYFFRLWTVSRYLQCAISDRSAFSSGLGKNFISIGYGYHIPVPTDALTRAILTFHKNYYGKDSFEKVLFYRTWNLGRTYGIYIEDADAVELRHSA
jgi:hypothetical protein